MKKIIFLLKLTLIFGPQIPPLAAGEYADKIYPSVKTQHPNLIQAVNDYQIVVEEKNIAKSALKPRVDLIGEFGYQQNQIESNETSFHTDASATLIFQQPLFDIQRWFALARSHTNRDIGSLQYKLQQDQFLVTFVEALIRISQNKTKYFFARQNMNYYTSYFEQERERERVQHDTLNPGREFDWTKSLLLLTLDQDLRSGTRAVDTLYANYLNERSSFEVTLLRRKLENFIMVDPFVKRLSIPASEEEIVALVKRRNPALMIAKRGLKINDINLEEAKRLRWPKASLIAKSSLGTHDYDTLSHNKREDFFGLIITIPLFDGSSSRYKRKIAELEKDNAIRNLELLEMQLEDESRHLYKNINQNVKNINSLIESFQTSKKMIQIFLGERKPAPDDNMRVPSTNADRKRIMDTHFAISRDLALEQHEYLKNLIELYFLQGSFTQNQFSILEDRFFLNCNDYEKFVELGNIRN